MSLFAAISDRIYGYDYFISYAHLGGGAYPQALKNDLEARGFNVFIDYEEFGVGTNLPVETIRRIKMSSKLIVVGNEAAYESKWVNLEVDVALNFSKPVILIDIKNYFTDVENDNELKQILSDQIRLVDNSAESPSISTLEELERSFQITYRDTKRQKFFFRMAVAIVFFSIGLASYAEWNRRDANRQLIDAQVSESKLLANLANTHTENKEGERAIQLVWNGLPQDHKFDSRPIVDEASKALWEARYERRQLHSLGRQPHAFYNVVYSPDGSKIAGSSETGQVMVWFSKSGKLHQTFSPHKSAVRNLAFNIDGTVILSGSDDGIISYTRSSDGTLLYSFPTKDGPIYGMQLSPNGKILATRSSSNVVKLWDVESRELIWNLKGHTNSIWDFDFSNDSSQIVTGSKDKTAMIWNVSDGKPIAQLRGHVAGIVSVRFHPDGKRVLTGSHDATAALWDVKSETEISTYRLGIAVRKAIFDKQGKKIAVAGASFLQFWDVVSGEKSQRLEAHQGDITSIQFDNSGSYLITASKDATSQVWDTRKYKEIVKFSNHNDTVWQASFHPKLKNAVTASADGHVKLWSLSGDVETVSLRNHKDSIRGIRSSRDGKSAISVAADGGILKWDLVNKKMDGQPLNHGSKISAIGFNVDKDQFATAGEDGIIRIWDSTQMKQISIFEQLNKSITALALSSDGLSLSVGFVDGEIDFYGLADSGSPFLSIQANKTRVMSISFSDKGDQVVVGYSQGYVRIFDSSSGKMLMENKVGSWPVWDAKFFDKAKEKIVLSTCLETDNCAAAIFSTITKQKLIEFSGHRKTVYNFDLSQDKTLLATASLDGTVKVWRISDATELATLNSRKGEIQSVALDLNKTFVLSGSSDSTVRIWPIWPEPKMLLESTRRLILQQCLTSKLDDLSCPSISTPN